MSDYIKERLIILAFVIFIIFYNYYAEYIDFESINTPNDYARITDVDYTAVVLDEEDHGGNVLVKERITFDVHAASPNYLFWELWRDLPEDYVDGLKVSYDVLSVKEILSNGTEIPYEESSKLYWYDSDYTNTYAGYGPGKWYHSPGPYDNYYNYECVFFYVDGLYREQVTFEIIYEMYNASLKYKDASELYLTMYSENTIKYLESFKGQILVPTKDMPSKGNYNAYTYGTNNHEFEFSESDTLNEGYHTFYFELDEEDLKFRPYNEYIEFTLLSYGEDAHKFTEYAPDNYYSNEDALEELRSEQKEYELLKPKAMTKKIILLIIMIGMSGFVIWFTVTNKKRVKSKHSFFEPTDKIIYFRDIPSNLDPSFASDLVFIKDKPLKDDGNKYAAILLSLVRKDYIELEKINPDKGDTESNIKIIVKHRSNYGLISNYSAPTTVTVGSQTITVNESNSISNEMLSNASIAEKNLEPLTKTEEYYYNLIVRHSRGLDITMSAFQARVSMDYSNTNTFVQNMENSTVNIGIDQGYLQKSNFKEVQEKERKRAKKHTILGIILITIVNIISYHTRLDLIFGGWTILGICLIICGRYLKKQSKEYALLTEFGENEYQKWRGLYNFLNSNTLMNEKTIIDVHLWEKYLVYATAFGISEKVIKALELNPNIVNTSPVLKNSYCRSHNFRSSSRSFSRNTRTTSHTYRGGFSSGRHYGGGGRGGGGGGGGH